MYISRGRISEMLRHTLQILDSVCRLFCISTLGYEAICESWGSVINNYITDKRTGAHDGTTYMTVLLQLREHQMVIKV